jgi:hypothetical protein
VKCCRFRTVYDTNTDWSQAQDLAAEMPERLDELKALFMEEAQKYNVLPLDDRRAERFNSDLAGRPTLITGTSQLLFGGMGRLTENAVINVKNKSHSVTAELTVPDGGVEGVMGADRHRRRCRRPRPPDHARGATAHRHGATVTRLSVMRPAGRSG